MSDAARPEAPRPEHVAVIGLGYVGLPLAVAFARHGPVTAYDVDEVRVGELARGVDRHRDVAAAELASLRITWATERASLAAASAYVIAVPTPLGPRREPDLRAIEAAAGAVGDALAPGDLVVIESTVFPGVTEQVVASILADRSGLAPGAGFQLGYSPERVNPGDPDHGLGAVVKVVAGVDAASLERVVRLYAPIVPAGLHRAPSIQVAEMAKLVENTQRDVNIALMNEVALIAGRLGLRTRDVLAAARTKWNFLDFQPGLVGGHCISVDPYYLTARAQAAGHHPEVILAGRRINDEMGRHVAREAAKRLTAAGFRLPGARVGVLGLAFKADWPDVRNSLVVDVVRELESFGAEVFVHDPVVDADEARRVHGIVCRDLDALRELDGVVLAVDHRAFVDRPPAALLGGLVPGGVVVDVKSAWDPDALPDGVRYWSL